MSSESEALRIPEHAFNDVILLKLAREMAMGIRPVEAILETHRISKSEWTRISNLQLFQDYLTQFVAEWESATNTAERVKLKSLAFVEESLPEFYARAHDSRESLAAKTEILKAVARFAGVGGTADVAGVGEKFSVTINIGADQQVRIEKSVQPPMIEGDTL
jgi:hypothetical protein